MLLFYVLMGAAVLASMFVLYIVVKSIFESSEDTKRQREANERLRAKTEELNRIREQRLLQNSALRSQSSSSFRPNLSKTSSSSSSSSTYKPKSSSYNSSYSSYNSYDYDSSSSSSSSYSSYSSSDSCSSSSSDSGSSCGGGGD